MNELPLTLPSGGTVLKPPPRIYFVGAHRTGKTTCAQWAKETYGLPLITELARTVLA